MIRTLLLLSAAAAALTPALASAQDKPDASAPTPTPSPAPPAGNDIVITGSILGTGGATSATKVDSKAIRENGGASIADSLAATPGVASSGFATGASRPIIRGMDATRVRILENGTSSSDVSEVGPDHGVPIDPLSARSIEVVRGPATLRYGSQAIGGVVNVLNNRVPLALPSKTIDGELNGSFDTVSDTWQGSALADVKLGKLVLHADGFYRDAGDYSTPLGVLANTFFRGNGEAFGASYFFGGSRIGVGVVQYNAKYGIPAEDSFIDLRQTKLVVKSSFGLGSGVLKTLTIDGSYADYHHDEDAPDGTILSTFLNKEYDGRAELLLGKIGPFSNSAVGIELQNRRFSALGEGQDYLFPTETQNESAFLFTEIPITSDFKLQASGRVEWVDVTGTPASNVFTRRNFTPLGGAISALFEPSQKVRFGLSFSSTARAPGITELFARGAHDGPATFETGDPGLQIERANSLEATVKIHDNRFTFEASVYSTWFNNYVYGDLTGRTCDEDGNCLPGNGLDLKELFYRQQGAHFRGFEGDASYMLVQTQDGGLKAHVLTDMVRATLDDGNNVPRIPPYRIGGGLSWASTRVDAGFLFLYVGEQDKFGAFEDSTPSYVALSAQAAWRPFKSAPGVEFSIVGKNLTNDVQRDASALNRDVVVMPGRNIRFVVRLATF